MNKQTLINYSVVFLLGFLTCLYFTRAKCVDIPIKYDLIETEKRIFDTIYVKVDKIIPKPTIVYKTLSEFRIDSIDKIQFVEVGLDTSHIPVNHYEDSLKTDKYKLKWSAETFGYLTSMVPELEIYEDSLVIEPIIKHPKWTISTGISNRLNYKIGAGYKGWILEAEFNKLNFNQIYITKQFTF